MTSVTQPATIDAMSDDNILARLRKDTAAAARLAERRDPQIVEARRAGNTWRVIAEAAGLTELATRKAAVRGNDGVLPTPEEKPRTSRPYGHPDALAVGEPMIEWCERNGLDPFVIPEGEIEVRPEEGILVAAYREVIEDGDPPRLSPPLRRTVDTYPPRWRDVQIGAEAPVPSE